MFYVWIEVKLLTIKLDIQRKRALVCFYVKTIRFIGKNANNWKKCLLSSKIPIISTVFKFLTVLVKLLSCFIIHHVIFQVFLWWADVWVGMLTFLKSMLNYKLHEKCWRNKADLSANTKTFFFFFYIYKAFQSVPFSPNSAHCSWHSGQNAFWWRQRDGKRKQLSQEIVNTGGNLSADRYQDKILHSSKFLFSQFVLYDKLGIVDLKIKKWKSL